MEGMKLRIDARNLLGALIPVLYPLLSLILFRPKCYGIIFPSVSLREKKLKSGQLSYFRIILLMKHSCVCTRTCAIHSRLEVLPASATY